MGNEKVWLITGASRGLGRLWAEAALSRGDKVAATARDIKSLDGLVKTYGGLVLPLLLDVSNSTTVENIVRQAHRHFGEQVAAGAATRRRPHLCQRDFEVGRLCSV